MGKKKEIRDLRNALLDVGIEAAISKAIILKLQEELEDLQMENEILREKLKGKHEQV